MEQKLLLKKKKKKEEKEELKSEQKMALHALQKQKQILELKEWLFILGFIDAGSLLRVPMQAFPNVEPLTFFALLTGWLFGWKKGAMVGASSLYISNFLVFGGQGPWVIFQVIGYGLVGFLGGFLRKKSGIFSAMGLAFLATVMLQIILNIGWSFFIGFNFIAAMFTAIPFALIHIVSNTIFAAALPKVKKVIDKIGKFDEKKLCNDLMAKLNCKLAGRMPKKHPT